MTLYVGLDVHRGGVQAAIVPMASSIPGMWSREEVTYLRIRNSRHDFQLLEDSINANLDKSQDVMIAVDITGGYYSAPVIHFLDRLGHHVFSLEPKEVKGIREGLLRYENKTDRIDALALAIVLHLKQSDILPRKAVRLDPSANSQASALLNLVRLRWQHVKLETQATNRLRQLLCAAFPEAEAECFPSIVRVLHRYPSREEILERNHLEQVPELRNSAWEHIVKLARDSVGVTDDVYREAILSWADTRLDTAARIKSLTEKIKTGVRKHPYGSILLSFPGVAEITAATVIGLISDIRRWPNANSLRKSFGIYGVITQSGASIGTMRPGKGGNRDGKRALFQSVIVCINPRTRPNDIRDYYERQVASGKPKIKAIYASMSKLVDLFYHCLTVKEPYRYLGRYRFPPP